MPILRNKYRERFTVLANDALEDERLSYEACGMLAYLASKPDNWQIRATHLARVKNIGREKTQRILRELRQAGYLTSHYPTDENGRFQGEELILNEIPDDGNPGCRETRTPENPDAGKPVDVVNNDSLPITDKEVSTDDSPQKGGGAKKAKRQEYPADFEAVWSQYPKRAGDNPKRKAYQAFNARLREGHTADEMEQGVRRYAAYVQATERVGTEFVQQGVRFLGPDKPFENEWTPPASSNDGWDGIQQRAQEAAERRRVRKMEGFS